MLQKNLDLSKLKGFWMAIIIDSNIVIAAIISNSLNRKIILYLYPDIYFPQAMLEEIEKYKEIIKKKANMDEQKYRETFEKIFKYVKIISNEEIIKYKLKAEKIMEKIDPKDHLLIAASFALGNCTIWSNDPHLKEQNIIKTFTTMELYDRVSEFLNH